MSAKYEWNFKEAKRELASTPFARWGYYDPDRDLFNIHSDPYIWIDLDESVTHKWVMKNLTFLKIGENGSIGFCQPKGNGFDPTEVLHEAPNCWLVPKMYARHEWVFRRSVPLMYILRQYA